MNHIFTEEMFLAGRFSGGLCQIRRICNRILSFIRTHKQMWVFSYAILYLAWWSALEDRPLAVYHVIHSPVDDWIPFCEVFIIPYLLWFLYFPAVFLYLLLTDREKDRFYRYTVFAYTGMTFFLLFSTLYPNTQLLRPRNFPRDNVWTGLLTLLYRADTSTNIFPSIHVYNSIAAHLAILHDPKLSANRTIRTGSAILAGSIIASTMFLKQHSVIDVCGGIVFAQLMDRLVYRTDWSELSARIAAGHRIGTGQRKNRLRRGIVS